VRRLDASEVDHGAVRLHDLGAGPHNLRVLAAVVTDALEAITTGRSDPVALSEQGALDFRGW
jgi:hypothetical protein